MTRDLFSNQPPPTSATSSNFSKSEQVAWVRLAQTPKIGPVTFRNLLATYGSARHALSLLPELSRIGGRKKPLTPPSEAKIKQQIDALAEAGAEILFWGHAPYPALLAVIEDAPPFICIKGHASLFAKPGVGMVGARNASANGKLLARHFGQALVEKGYIVISGLARGIDGAAHMGALTPPSAPITSDIGGTIAVLAGGLDHYYPPEHQDLQDQIASQGLLVSEHLMGTKPQARFFPRRNRIISGLSQAILVVEATPRSGSLITARYAADQGRDVFAIPGSPMDQRSEGANALIRDGATLIRHVDDIDQELQQKNISSFTLSQSQKIPDLFATKPPLDPDFNEIDKLVKYLRQHLNGTAIAIDELIRDCHFPTGQIQAALLSLELAGCLIRHPGNKVSLKLDPASHQTEHFDY